MSHGQFHHNRGSLRRFIRTEAGMESFPYTAAYPLDYGARYHAYNGFFQNLFGGGGKAAADGAGAVAEGGAKAAAEGAAKPGGFFTGMGSSLVGATGEILGGIFTSNANANAQEASLASNERIAALKIAADRDAAIAIAAQNQQTGGMSGGMVALLVGGVAVVGTVGYFVLRKKK